MATEYTLQLKAQLDTTQVKQQLNQLQQQMGTFKNNLTGGKQSSSQLGAAPNMNVILSRLYQSILQLNKSINQLNLNQIKSTNGSRVSNSLMPIYAPGGNTRAPVQMRSYSRTANIVNGLLDDFVQMRADLGRNADIGDSLRDLTRLRNNPSRRNWNTAMGYLDEGYVWAEGLEERFGRAGNRAFGRAIRPWSIAQATAPYFAGRYDEPGRWGQRPDISNQQNPMQARLLRGAIGFGLHQMLPQAGNYLEATGNKGAATATNAFGNIAGQAAMGGLMAGPAGAAVMGSMAALGEAFRILTDRAKALGDALQEQESRVASAKLIDKGLKQQIQDTNDSRRLAVGDVGYFKNRLESTRNRLQKLKTQNAEIGEEPGSLTAYEEETKRKIEAFRAGSPTGTLPEYIKKRQRAADRYRQNLAEMPQLEQKIGQYEGDLDKLGVFSESKQESLDFRSNIKSAENYRLRTMKTIFGGDLDDLEARKARLYAKSEATGTPVNLGALEDLQKQIDSFKDKMTALNEEIGKRKDIQKSIQKNNLVTDINTLQDRLSNLAAPELNQVNSLAQYGFGISERSDEAYLKNTEDYMKEQTTLQRQLRDKVLKMSDYGTFSD